MMDDEIKVPTPTPQTSPDTDNTGSKTPLLPIPFYAIEPETWAKESIKRSAEYAGMPESSVFLMQARRFLALAENIKELKAEIEALKGKP